MSSPYGVCAAYPELAHRVAAELHRLAEGAAHSGGLLQDSRHLLATVNTCPVCEVRIEAERNAIQTVVDFAQNKEGAAGNHLQACCLPHLVQVVLALGAGQQAQSLLLAHARLFERIAEDMQRYALRHDALRRYLTSEEERQASQLALLLLAGHRSVGAPWSVESIAF